MKRYIILLIFGFNIFCISKGKSIEGYSSDSLGFISINFGVNNTNKPDTKRSLIDWFNANTNERFPIILVDTMLHDTISNMFLFKMNGWLLMCVEENKHINKFPLFKYLPKDSDKIVVECINDFYPPLVGGFVFDVSYEEISRENQTYKVTHTLSRHIELKKTDLSNTDEYKYKDERILIISLKKGTIIYSSSCKPKYFWPYR